MNQFIPHEAESGAAIVRSVFLTGLLLISGSGSLSRAEITAEYYNDMNLSSSPKVMQVETIAYNKTQSNSSVRYKGQIKARASGPHKLWFRGNDAGNMWIDNKLVTGWPWAYRQGGPHSIPYFFEKDSTYDLLLEVGNSYQIAQCFLWWEYRGQPMQIVPTEYLLPKVKKPSKPEVRIVRPVNHYNYIRSSGDKALAGIAASPAAMKNIALYIDGTKVKDFSGHPYNYDFSNLKQGKHTMKAVGEFKDGTTTEHGIEFYIDSDLSKTGSGLKGEYFSNETGSGTPKVTRTDATVSFIWGSLDHEASASPVSGIPADGFFVRWTGSVRADYDGWYTFRTMADDGTRLYVNDSLVFSHWKAYKSTNPEWEFSGARYFAGGMIYLKAGTWYPIKLEYHEGSNSAECHLFWEHEKLPLEIIPPDHLRPVNSIPIAIVSVPYRTFDERARSGYTRLHKGLRYDLHGRFLGMEGPGNRVNRGFQYILNTGNLTGSGQF